MTAQGLRVHPGTYVDSLMLMAATVTMDSLASVSWAGAVMASPRGLEDLAAAGFAGGELAGLGGNDLVLAVQAVDDDVAQEALRAGWDAISLERPAARGGGEQEPPTSIAQAVRRTEGANVAIISVPGDYAALDAHHALTAGLHVLLFSDGVPVEEEVELKARAGLLGLLVMGPGAGTAVLGGTGLGFANALGAGAGGGAVGAVGVVAAAGTGAQEVSALLDRWGVPVSQVVGVGGRDLSAAVQGRMAQLAARAMAADPGTDVVLLVSKPPDADAAALVLAECRTTRAVAVFLGLDGLAPPEGVQLAPTLEQGSLAAARLAGRPRRPWPTASSSGWRWPRSDWPRPGVRSGGSSAAGPSATRRSTSWPACWGRSTRTSRCARSTPFRRPTGPTCCWTWARRSTHGGDPTR